MSKSFASFLFLAVIALLAACEPKKGKEEFSETVASSGLELRIRVFKEGEAQNLAQGQHYQIECRSLGGGYSDSQWRLFDVGYMVKGFDGHPSKYLKVLNSTTAYSNLFGFVATFDGCKSHFQWATLPKMLEAELVNPVTPDLIKEVEINDRAVRLLLDPVAFRGRQKVTVSLIEGTNNWRVTVNGQHLTDVKGI